jgi:hypothetical protein
MTTVDERNAATSAAEVAAFMTDTPGPYFAYAGVGMDGLQRGTKITTWTGDTLATVERAGFVFRSGFGDARQNFRARGINGATYSGTAFLSAGDYVRMRPVKP